MSQLMKIQIQNLFLLPMLVAGLGFIPSSRVTAQTFTTLYSFSQLMHYVNSDGANPVAGLILSGNTLYGTADMAAVRAMARCSRSTPMAQVLRTCIVSRHSYRSIANSDGAYPVCRIDFIGQHPVWDDVSWRQPMALARCSPSTPMARVLRTCIFSRQPSPFITNSDGADPRPV